VIVVSLVVSTSSSLWSGFRLRQLTGSGKGDTARLRKSTADIPLEAETINAHSDRYERHWRTSNGGSRRVRAARELPGVAGAVTRQVLAGSQVAADSAARLGESIVEHAKRAPAPNARILPLIVSPPFTQSTGPAKAPTQEEELCRPTMYATGRPPIYSRRTLCLDELSKDVRGDLHLVEARRHECREEDCLTLTAEHLLRLELTSHACAPPSAHSSTVGW